MPHNIPEEQRAEVHWGTSLKTAIKDLWLLFLVEFILIHKFESADL
jgi:hypothetical protein